MDENAQTYKAKLKERKENDKVYNDLILACSGEIGFTIIDGSMTKYLRDVDVELAWRELRRRFEPDTSVDEVKLKREFNSNKLSSRNKDPEV